MTNSSATQNQIKKGSFISYVTILLNIVLGILYTPWILRTVGSSNYGLYTLASSFVTLFLLDFGMSMAVSRYIANYRAAGKQDYINKFVGISIKFYLIICSVAAVALAIIYFFISDIYKGLTSSELETFKIIFIITGIFVVFCFPVNIFNGILNAYEKFALLKGTDIINKIGTVIFTIIGLLINPNVFYLVFVIGFFNLLAFIAKVIIVFKTTPVKIVFKKDKNISISEIFSFSALSTLNTISQQLTINLMPTVLGMVTNSFCITVFGFARIIESYVFSISQGVNGFFLPSVSRTLDKKENASDVLELMIKVGRLNLSIIALLIIGMGILGGDFVNVWVGDEFGILYYCFLALTITYFFSAPQQIAMTSVNVLNKIKYTSPINFGISVCALIVSYFTAQYFGILGVCVTIMVSNLIKYIIYNIIYSRVLKIDVFTFFKKCYFRFFFAFLATIAISCAFHFLFPFESLRLFGWLRLFIEVAFISIFYVIFMWIIGWNDYEKKLILSFLPFKKHIAS